MIPKRMIDFIELSIKGKFKRLTVGDIYRYWSKHSPEILDVPLHEANNLLENWLKDETERVFAEVEVANNPILAAYMKG